MAVSLRTMPCLLIAAATLSLTACGGAIEEEGGEQTAVPAAEEPAVIGERHDNFEAMSDAFKPIGETMKTDTPDVAVIAQNAAIISANLQKIPDHFPAGTGMDDGYDTDALAVIWEQPEDFSKLTQNAIAAGAALVDAAATGDMAVIGPAVGALGNSCKDCHDTYRADDE